jgi:hypothetical protein
MSDFQMMTSSTTTSAFASESASIGECATEQIKVTESDEHTTESRSSAHQSARRQHESGMSNSEFRRALRALQKKVDRLKEEHLELFEENMRLRHQWAYLEAEFVAQCTGQVFPPDVRTTKRRPSIQRSSPTELVERARRSVGQFKEALASIRKAG